jgi:hypothetical protein
MNNNLDCNGIKSDIDKLRKKIIEESFQSK